MRERHAYLKDLWKLVEMKCIHAYNPYHPKPSPYLPLPYALILGLKILMGKDCHLPQDDVWRQDGV